MAKNTVVNIRFQNDDTYVYIGRGSKWGNPFILGKDGDRDEVCDKHEEWIRKQPHLLESLDELVGKRLGCFCFPLRCHGDTLIKLIDERDNLDWLFGEK